VNPPLKPKPVATLFNPQQNVKEVIDAAIKRGAPERRRVIVFWGFNASRWSIKLQEQLDIPDTARMLRFDYELVAADVGEAGFGPLNMALAQTYGAKIQVEPNMMPYVTIIETIGEKAGQPVLNRSTQGLEKPRSSKENGDYYSLKIQDFLGANRAPQPTGQDVVSGALAESKSRSLPLFLYFLDQEDPWCHRFYSWLKRPEVAEALAKHFVVATVDLVRYEGAAKEFSRFGGEQSEASPWYVMLDANAQRLAPLADKGEKDLGYPTGDEVANFVAMMKRVAPAMTDAESKTLTDGLAAVVAPPSPILGPTK
jgi:hypothetical protein